jgi:serine protease Do
MASTKIRLGFLAAAGLATALGAGALVSSLSCQTREKDTVRIELAEQLKKLSDTQDAFAAVSALARGFVVSITAKEAAPVVGWDWIFGPPERVKGGSGIVVDASGWILTNRHVVEDTRSISVRFADGSTYSGERYLAAKDTDLAFIKIAGGPFKTAALGDSEQVRVGDWAIAVGSPFNFDQTVTVGIISAKGRRLAQGEGGVETFFQTDAAINSGNSGGPLLNLKGEVIGVNTAIYSPTRTYAGIGFAIPINRAKDLMTHLDKEVRPAPGGAGAWLGVETRELRESEMAQLGLEGGLVVQAVRDGSPAQQAGLRQFDILLALDDRPIRSGAELTEAVGQLRPGTRVRLKVLRDGGVVEIPCSLGERK